MSSNNDLRNRAKEIRNACEEGENTSERIGAMFEAVIDDLERAKPRYVKFTELDTMGLGSTQAVSLAAWEPHTRYTVIDGNPLTESDGATLVNMLGMLDIFKTSDDCVVTQVFTTNCMLDVNTGKIEKDHQHHMQSRLFRYVRFMPTNGENAYKWGSWRYDDATHARNVFDHWLVPTGIDHMTHERYGVMVAPVTEEEALEPDDMPAFEMWGDDAFLRLTFRTTGGGTRHHIPLPRPTFPVNGESPAKAGLFGKTAFTQTVAAAVRQTLIADAAKIGATYDKSTGLFSFNTLTDITPDEMRNIILFGKSTFVVPGECGLGNAGSGDRHIRTNWVHCDADAVSAHGTLYAFSKSSAAIEVIQLPMSDQWSVRPTDMRYFCYRCTNLRHIYGWINMRNWNGDSSNMLTGCSKLETLNLYYLTKSINLSDLESLSAESVRFLVDYAANTDAITVSVHPTVFLKLAGLYDWGKVIGGNTEKVKWAAIMATAAERDISFATA